MSWQASLTQTCIWTTSCMVTAASEKKHHVNLKDVLRPLTGPGLCLKKSKKVISALMQWST